MKSSLIIACDGEAASGKSTGAKLISKKYKLFHFNSGLLYRYASKIILKNKPKKILPFLKKKFKFVTYNKIKKQSLFTQEISNHVGFLAKRKEVRCTRRGTTNRNLVCSTCKYSSPFYFVVCCDILILICDVLLLA